MVFLVYHYSCIGFYDFLTGMLRQWKMMIGTFFLVLSLTISLCLCCKCQYFSSWILICKSPPPKFLSTVYPPFHTICCTLGLMIAPMLNIAFLLVVNIFPPWSILLTIPMLWICLPPVFIISLEVYRYFCCRIFSLLSFGFPSSLFRFLVESCVLPLIIAGCLPLFTIIFRWLGPKLQVSIASSYWYDVPGLVTYFGCTRFCCIVM